MRAMTLPILLALAACTTIREHPRTTAAMAGIVATSVALSIKLHHRQPILFEDVKLPMAPCATDPGGCR